MFRKDAVLEIEARGKRMAQSQQSSMRPWGDPAYSSVV